MSRVGDARAALHTALVTQASASALPLSERVHRVTPNRVDPPCLFIGGVSLDRVTVGTPGVSMVIATFPVYAVADGRPDEQTLALDEMVAIVWDAAFACGALPNDATPAAIDVGGPSVRGALIRVESTISALSLCAPDLEAITHG